MYRQSKGDKVKHNQGLLGVGSGCKWESLASNRQKLYLAEGHSYSLLLMLSHTYCAVLPVRRVSPDEVMALIVPKKGLFEWSVEFLRLSNSRRLIALRL
jgi:hypothetical protein